MRESFGVTSSGEEPPRGNNNHDQSTFGQNTYTARPLAFNGGSTEFEWWKSNMYTYIIGLDDDLLDILEDDINFHVDGVGMVSNRKSLTPNQKMFIESMRE